MLDHDLYIYLDGNCSFAKIIMSHIGSLITDRKKLVVEILDFSFLHLLTFPDQFSLFIKKGLYYQITICTG